MAAVAPALVVASAAALARANAAKSATVRGGLLMVSPKAVTLVVDVPGAPAGAGKTAEPGG